MVSVQSTVDTGHEDMVHDAQMDYYGTKLATCSSDRSIKIFDVKDGTQTHVADLRAHEGPVWQLAWAHPSYGQILASCSYDRKVRLSICENPGKGFFSLTLISISILVNSYIYCIPYPKFGVVSIYIIYLPPQIQGICIL